MNSIPKSTWSYLVILGLLLVTPGGNAGFQSIDKRKILTSLYTNPCDCRGEGEQLIPLTQYTQSVDCGDKVAYLEYFSHSMGGTQQHWKCIPKPKPLPTLTNVHCPSNCVFTTQMHVA